MKAVIGAVLAWLVLTLSVAARPVAWVQFTETGAQARVVTDAAECPAIRIDGRRKAMHLRAGPSNAYANRVCAADLPANSGRIIVEGQTLRAPLATPNRLVIFGDSGCRLKGAFVQQCNDPGGWPFARIAALAAAQKPDLVIHVGDYYYRETPCPAGDAGCRGSPYGDKWPTWKAELFDPAGPLLAAAPWVFARGNHEDCQRGGGGWFRMLDAATSPRTCPARSDTWTVDLGGAKLFIVDSADSQDTAAPAALVSAFASRLSTLPAAGGEPAWIVTHRPVWSALPKAGNLVDGLTNATERAAVRGADLSSVAVVLSGHVHNFSSLDFGPARPPQLIVGTGGDVLTGSPPFVSGVADVDGLPAKVFTTGRFGYFVFDRQGDDWVGSFHGLDDAILTRCRLHARALACVAAP